MKDKTNRVEHSRVAEREGLRILNLCLEGWWLLQCSDGDRKWTLSV